MKNYLLLLSLILCSWSVNAQFRTNGTAISQANNCFRLTSNLTNQSGSVWYLSSVDISKPFDLYFEVNLGCSNGGADGMAFVLQPISTSVGSSGGGLGYQGITPSLAIEMDTYQNGNWGDPVYDHIAIMSNGVNDHTSANNLAGPVAALAGNGNLEDCNFHDFRITWDTATFTMRVYMDCSLRLTYTGNIVQTIFSGSPYVFWGFTAATGALTNEHRFCLNYISFSQALQDTAICKGDTLPLNVGTGFTYSWSPAAGLSSTSIANPRAFPDTTTTYYVSVTDPCMNTRVDSITIVVHDSAALVFDLGPTDSILCGSSNMPLDLTRNGVNFLWQNGSNAPSFTVMAPGKYWAQLSNTCGVTSDTIDIQYESFPTVDLGPDTLVCDFPSLLLDATFMSQTTPGTQYLWQDGSILPTYLVTQDDTLHVQLSNYCGTAADTIAVHFLDSPLPFSLGADTVICETQPISLNIYQPGMMHSWNSGSTDSVISVNTSGLYTATVQNVCGAETDNIRVTAVGFPNGTLPPDTILCAGQTYVLTANVPLTSLVVWSDGSLSTSIIVNPPGGEIICYETNVCGTNSDTIIVLYDSIPQPQAGPDSLLCQGELVTLDITTINATSYKWQGGPSSAQWTVGSPATYIGEASNHCGTGRDTVVITRLPAPAINLGPDVLLCDGEDIVFDYTGQNWTFLWNDGFNLPRRAIQDSGFYWLEVSNRCGTDRDEIHLSEEKSPQLLLPKDTVACTGEVLLLDVYAPNITRYRWSDGSTNSSFSAMNQGLYWAQGENACGIARDSFQLWLERLPTPDLGPDTALCLGQSLNFNVFHARAKYLWQNGSPLATHLADRAGDYWVEVSNSCGTGRAEMTLILDQAPPPINLGADQLLCVGDSILLDATVFASATAPVDYRWEDGSTDSLRWVTEDGLYLVEIANRCGRVSDLMEATFEEPLLPYLGGDTLRCQNEHIRLDARIEGVASYRWQDGSNEAQYVTDHEGIFWVTVENSCGPVTDTVLVTDTDCTCSLFVPSAFTPNNDQHNDGFCIGYECELLAYDFKVYNRWGQLIWQTEDPSACWDGVSMTGGAVPEGVYVYILTYQSRENKRAAKRTLNGTITLIR